MKFVFFSMRNFERDGGGSIRMYGVLNTLASKGHDILFISNAKNYGKFHQDIQHINIGYECSPKQKTILNGLLGILPASVVYAYFSPMFKMIEKAIALTNEPNRKIFFFEYLDNSIGYILRKKGRIRKFYNDLHGIATIEFQYQREQATKWKDLLQHSLKYKVADCLDKKVLEAADGVIYASAEMKNYYENRYSGSRDKQFSLLPYVLGSEACNRAIDFDLQKIIKEKYELKEDDFIIFFAGGYKPTAGIEDLIAAFESISEKHKGHNVKLFLIGGGPTYQACQKLIDASTHKSNIITVTRVPYDELITYQSIANVIVNPDRQNPYSELIVHLKYFDALVSGRLVINPAFSSVKEINKEDKLSLTYEPSNQVDLIRKIELCLLKYDELMKKYQTTKAFVCNNLTYDNMVERLGEFK